MIDTVNPTVRAIERAMGDIAYFRINAKNNTMTSGST